MYVEARSGVATCDPMFKDLAFQVGCIIPQGSGVQGSGPSDQGPESEFKAQGSDQDCNFGVLAHSGFRDQASTSLQGA